MHRVLTLLPPVPPPVQYKHVAVNGRPLICLRPYKHCKLLCASNGGGPSPGAGRALTSNTLARPGLRAGAGGARDQQMGGSLEPWACAGNRKGASRRGEPAAGGCRLVPAAHPSLR